MDTKTKHFDRTTEDVGNIVLLEHVNVTQPDQRPTTLFYVVALGGTRDPYIFVGLENMWVNYGRTQIQCRAATRSRRWCAARSASWCPISRR